MIIDPASDVANATGATLAAAAGWLCGAAVDLLGDRSYQHRAVAALVENRITIEFLFQLEQDIRADCLRAHIAPPSIQEFYRGHQTRSQD